MGGTDEYFSVIALFILFRETVEASIIVSVLMQFLSRSFPVLKKQVWWGVAFGLLLSIIFGVVFSILFYVAKENVFSGQDKSIFKGSIAWFAGILITILAFAMLRYKGWEDKIKRKLEAMAQKELDKSENQIEEAAPPPPTWHGRMVWRTKKTARTVCAPVGCAMAKCWVATSLPIERGVEGCWHAGERATRATGRVLTCGRCCAADADGDKNKSELVENAEVAVEAKHGFGIFMLVFSTVLREGVESVIFLAGVGNAQPSSLPLPGLVGFVCGLAAGVFCYYTGKQVKDLKWFMIIMSIILFFIAGGQFMLGADYLYQGGMFGYCSPFQNERPWYMQPRWDISECCGDTDPAPGGKESKPQYKFFALARAIFGYQDKPTIIEIVVYSVYWALVLAAAAFKYWKGSLFDADFKHTNEMKKKAREEAKQRAAMERAFTSSGQLPDEATLVEAKKLALTSASTQDLPSIDNESNSRQSSDASPVAGAGVQPAEPLQDRPTQQPAQQHMQQ